MSGRSRSTAAILLVLLAGALVVWTLGASSWPRLAASLIASYLILWVVAFLATRAPRTETAIRFALSTTGIGVLWLCLEVLALIGLANYPRLFAAPIAEWWYAAPYNLSDRELLYTHRPHLRLSGSQPGDIGTAWCIPSARYTYAVRYDRNGFRNDSDLTAADIAVIGDSFIEAPTIAADRTVTAVLARLTGQTVANLGMSAYGPQQELAVLRRLALPLRPRVIIWAFYEGNDLKDVARYDAAIASVDRIADPWSSLVQLSFTRNALSALSRLISPCRPNPALWSGSFQKATGQTVPMHFVHRSEPLSPEALESFERVVRILLAANELARAQGAGILVAFVPTSFRVYRGVVRCSEDSACATASVSDLPQRLARAISRLSSDIRYVDLTPALSAEAERGELVYRPDDTHWTIQGHEVAAAAIATAAMPMLGPR